MPIGCELKQDTAINASSGDSYILYQAAISQIPATSVRCNFKKLIRSFKPTESNKFLSFKCNAKFPSHF